MIIFAVGFLRWLRCLQGTSETAIYQCEKGGSMVTFTTNQNFVKISMIRKTMICLFYYTKKTILEALLLYLIKMIF